MEEPRAVGEAFNIGDTKPLTQVEVVEKLAKAANVEPALVRVPRDIIAQAGGNAMDEPYYFGEYFDLAAHHENIGKVTRMLKMKLTPFEAGLKETYKWYTRNHKPRPTLSISTISCWRWRRRVRRLACRPVQRNGFTISTPSII